MQTRGDFVESLLNNAQELFFVDAVGWTTLAYLSLIDILNAFFLWCSVDVVYIWHLRRGRLASSLPWLAWEWLLLAHDIVHLHEVALCIILRLWPVDDARAMSVEVHLHLSESLFRHLDLCRHLKTLSELYERIVIKVNLGLLIYHFIYTTGWILLLIWSVSVGIVGVTIIISLTRVTVWSTDQINFWVALDTWSTWDGCHDYARLSLNGLKGFDLRTIAARHSANRVILGLTFLGMGEVLLHGWLAGGAWRTQARDYLVAELWRLGVAILTLDFDRVYLPGGSLNNVIYLLWRKGSVGLS